jgi:tRNA pseudouridine38-40 synthase
MRLALGLQYDGSAFHGWQTQADRQTVQDAVEEALAQLAGAPVPTICAGRTDAGVHATYQVVHIDPPAARPLAAWVRGVNSFLSQAAVVRWAVEVPQTFHARFGATARRYDYWLLNDPVRSPLLANRTGWLARRLQLEPMREAAALLVGRHDFSAFRSAECQAASPVRELRQLDIARFGNLLRFRLVANAFLHHMVRNLVGTLVYVGLGRQPPHWVAGVREGRDRSAAAPTFAAAGLYLTGVEYDPAFGLPAAPDEIAPACGEHG